MRIIHRHPIPVDDQDHTISCCASGRVVHVGITDDGLNGMQVWIEQVEPHIELWDRTFRVFATGQEIPDGLHHMGSAVVGFHVHHLYERSPYRKD